MENEILERNSGNPIYKKAHLQIAAIFGGPLAIVYIIAENYKQLGYPEKITRTWIIGLLLSIAFIALVLFLPPSFRQQNILIPLISIIIGTAIMQSWQGEDIRLHVENGNPVYSYGRALLIGFVNLGITFFALFTFLMIIKIIFGLEFKS